MSVICPGFAVTRSGSCSGYAWHVRWRSKQGDQPLIGVDGGDLTGDNVVIKTETLLDGGLWIRPLRGDMLRLPETEPQVGPSHPSSALPPLPPNLLFLQPPG